jgi:hypothetical protein
MTSFQQKLLRNDDPIVQEIRLYRESVSTQAVDYVTELVSKKLSSGNIFIPLYQRPFVWTDIMQSRFIESLILKLPIPYIFLCQNHDGRLEVVDGSQRLQSIERFRSDGLRLRGLEKLSSLNAMFYSDLPESEQRIFDDTPIKSMIFSDRTDQETRFDIFKRLNTGGRQLTDAQIRAGALKGPFYDLIISYAISESFVRMAPMVGKKDPEGDRAELVTRFFAYAERYLEFKHDVREFLDDYVASKNRQTSFDPEKYATWFDRMLQYVEHVFPYGFRRSPASLEIPRVRFEAIAVGTHLAIESGRLNPVPDFSWLESKEFKEHCRTDASNSGSRLRGRVEYVRDRLKS